MRAKPIEIRWHNTKPIYSTDFQPSPPSNLDVLIPTKSHPYTRSEQDKSIERQEQETGCGKVWRLATAGGDNMVMMWLVFPKPTLAQVAHHRTLYQLTAQQSAGGSSQSKSSNQDTKQTHNAPIVEYLTTLAKHQGVVNVVRFCPKGEMLASAGDDGNVLLWVLATNTSTTAAFGESAADKMYERESWRTRLMLRGPAQCEIYDVAWSPCGDFLLTGDTAKTARIWNVTDGLCIKQITEHSNFVQGVAWDPLGKFIATQSSDRSMNVYQVQINRDDSSGSATADVHHVGRNFKIDLLNQQINSWATHQDKDEERRTNPAPTSTPNPTQAPNSAASSVGAGQISRPRLDSRTMSTLTSLSEPTGSHQANPNSTSNRILSIPPTPSTTCSTQFNDECLMQPPSEIPHHTSTSSIHSQHLRHHSRSRQSSVVSNQTMSPSSLRPIRSPSPVPPMPAISVNEAQHTKSVLLYGDEGSSAFFRRLTWSVDGSMLITPTGRWENSLCFDGETKMGSKGKGRETANRGNEKKKRKSKTGEAQDEDDPFADSKEESSPTVFIYGRGSITSGGFKDRHLNPPLARLPGHKTGSVAIRFSPVVYRLRSMKDSNNASDKVEQPIKIVLGVDTPMREVALDQIKVECPIKSIEASSVARSQKATTPGLFDLPYRMVYAVATHDSVFVYDTQQSSPICVLSNLHYSSFTDVSWTSDGEGLILSSSDGYCSLVSFDQNELGEPMDEQSLATYLPDRTQPTQLKEEKRLLNMVLPPKVESKLEPPQPKICRPPPTDTQENNPSKRKRVALTYEGPLPR